MKEILADEKTEMTKKEKLRLSKKCDKTNRYLGGIKNMSYIPDLLFVVDTNKEHLAIQEA